MLEYEVTIWDGEDLMPLADQWAKDSRIDDFAPHVAERDMREMHERGDSEIFVLKDPEKNVVGAMGITILDMFYTEDFYSAVRYWYVLKEHRAMAFKLMAKARRWSLEKRCTKMMVCSNRLCDPSDKFYKTLQFTEYETVFIRDL
jgi:hypothetical protein